MARILRAITRGLAAGYHCLKRQGPDRTLREDF
jgi:hypothetical protein